MRGLLRERVTLNDRIKRSIQSENFCTAKKLSPAFCQNKCVCRFACWIVYDGIDRYIKPLPLCRRGCRKEIECEECSENA
jgi:hypothetical protein